MNPTIALLTYSVHQLPHSANLQLEMRSCGTRKNDIDSEAVLRFRLVFPVPVSLEEEKVVALCAWRELELEHLEHPGPEYVPLAVSVSPPREIQVHPWPVDSTTEITTTLGNEGLGRYES